jgi:hypothetical protein
LVFVLVGGSAPGLAAPNAEDAGASKGAPQEKAGGEAAGKGTPAPQGGAEGDATPTPTVDPKVAEESCKTAVAKLRSGDFSALESLPENQRKAILARSNAIDVLTCLAVADGKESHCDPLEEQAKKACKEQWKLGRELKGLSKEKVKAHLLYRTCASNSPDMDCALVRDAMGNGNAAKCKELKEPAKQTFCAALVTGDARKCDVLQGVERAYCSAFASDDSSHCPKESPDCIAMARGFAALKKGGLEGFADIDARIAAASMGTKACATLVSNLEGTCSKDSKE